jgi:hypothetical protein
MHLASVGHLLRELLLLPHHGLLLLSLSLL